MRSLTPGAAQAPPGFGHPDRSARILTPALLIDRRALGRNLDRMAEAARQYGVALRPHAKTHKCSQIARLQVEAGAIGLCCATLGEAEALAAAGITGLLLTSPVGVPGKAERAAALAQSADMICTADGVEAVDHLQAAADALGVTLRVMADLDLGSGRSGAVGPDNILRVVDHITDAANLSYAGLQAYAGHTQHIRDAHARRLATERDAAQLEICLNHLGRTGRSPSVITGSGTGCFPFDAVRGLYTECQPGSYVFMDREYHDIEQPDGAPHFETSLFVTATVISNNQPDRVTIDAGQKALFRAGPPPRVTTPRDGGWRYECAGDEHGWLIRTRESAIDLPLGARVELDTPHCDPTAALHPAYYVAEDGRLSDLWPIDARDPNPVSERSTTTTAPSP